MPAPKEDRRQRLDGVAVYFDTAVVLHLLGVCVPQLGDAARELRGLLIDHKMQLRMFQHTLVEVRGVLEATSNNLRNSRSKAVHASTQLSRTSREVLDYFVSAKKTSADVELIKAELDERLAELKIEVVDTPDHAIALTLDQSKLADKLQEGRELSKSWSP
jgi:hypothetical protein